MSISASEPLASSHLQDIKRFFLVTYITKLKYLVLESNAKNAGDYLFDSTINTYIPNFIHIELLQNLYHPQMNSYPIYTADI